MLFHTYLEGWVCNRHVRIGADVMQAAETVAPSFVVLCWVVHMA